MVRRFPRRSPQYRILNKKLPSHSAWKARLGSQSARPHLVIQATVVDRRYGLCGSSACEGEQKTLSGILRVQALQDRRDTGRRLSRNFRGMVSRILIPAAVMVLAVPTGPLALADSAEALFLAHCSSCHGASGEGGRDPRLNVPRLLKAPDDAALSTVITNGVPGSPMPGTRMTPEENRRLVAYVRGLGRAEAVESPGNRQSGESLFWGKGNCGACHTVGPRGQRLGPDLTEIGIRRGPAHLRASLLDPEAEIPDNFSVYRRVILMPDNFFRSAW